LCDSLASVVRSDAGGKLAPPLADIQQKSWYFRGHHIGWEEARAPGDGEAEDEEPIIILNGFGVGSFHQHRLMPELLSDLDGDDVGSGKGRTVYGVDYLGQGRSWPVDCDDGNSENEKGLRYCIDTWSEQIASFIEEVVLPAHISRCEGGAASEDDGPPRVHLVGNSVGGHLSALLAAKRPDLVRSVTLLNATPVWGLNLPGWSGHVPPPSIPRAIGRYLFDRIRDLNTIEKYLEAAYANRDAFDEKLCRDIRSCTEGKGGHAAFASILWSPPATFPSGPERTDRDFYAELSELKCDVLLVFGRDDPWCKPAFARRMADALAKREEGGECCHRYLDLENVGHCPNHEAPQAVGRAVRRWVDAPRKGKNRSDVALVRGEEEVFEEPWGAVTMREMSDGTNGYINIGLMDRLVSRLL